MPSATGQKSLVDVIDAMVFWKCGLMIANPFSRGESLIFGFRRNL
jgi:hypothetical protein